MAGEYPHLRALPPAPVPEYVSYSARVLKWSTIRVDSRTYSVPSRLIGVMVDVRLYPDHVEVYYKGHLVESMERIRGKGKARIDYRHIIGSLVRKPGAFARYPLQGAVVSDAHLPSGVRRDVRPGRESEPMWTTSGSCTLPRRRWNVRWRERSGGCLSRE